MKASTTAVGTSSARRHIVLVPGFAGFDALGQLEYYAGVTGAYQSWLKSVDSSSHGAVVLHYFDNLPTAGVATRAERFRTFLAKRIARGEIQSNDKIALVGHSTGGLDIRRLLFSGNGDEHDPLLQVDGGQEGAAGSTESNPSCTRPATAVDISQAQILEAVDRVAFLSVPQWGTNIADWTRHHQLLRRAVLEQMRFSVEAARMPQVDAALRGVVGGLGRLARTPDLVLAAQDALREMVAKPGDPTARADAEEAGSKLRLWLQHVVDDFAAIDDLAAETPPGSLSPAHYTDEQRRSERASWKTHGIATLSIATVAPRAFDFGSNQARPLTLSDPRTWPHHDLVPGARTKMDVTYLCAYRACAGGPFKYPFVAPSEYPRETDLFDISLFAADRVDLGDPVNGMPRIEAWDNDGIVNTASMLWPDGPETILVAADHGDIIGHYLLRRRGASRPVSGRMYASYDLLKSGAGFADDDFTKVWNKVFDFCVGSHP